MNGDAFVPDSNFVPDYLKGHAPHAAFMGENARRNLWVSVITEMEPYSFHGLADDEKGILDSFMASVAVAPLDNRIKDIAISFRRATRRKIPDSIVAATAIGLEAALMTGDRSLLKATFPKFIARPAQG